MIVKVCGIASIENLEVISSLNFAMIGFNFYPPSKRYIDSVVELNKENYKRVGVFVQASLSDIEEIVAEHRLDFIQLHGDEDPSYCEAASSIASIIKVFRVDASFDFNICEDYSSVSKYFLFDTFTKDFGGSGKKFDWKALDRYTTDNEFLLSGGISNEDLPAIQAITHPKFIGVDLNSKFEVKPGIKDYEKLKQFKNGIFSNSKLP